MRRDKSIRTSKETKKKTVIKLLTNSNRQDKIQNKTIVHHVTHDVQGYSYSSWLLYRTHVSTTLQTLYKALY